MKMNWIITGIVAGAVIVAISAFGIYDMDSPNTETQCLSLYKKIHENNKTPEMKLVDSDIIESQRQLLVEYVENDCPDFTDLDLMYESIVGEELR